VSQLAAKLAEWIRRYGLAAACLVLPWSMPNTWPAQVLVPWEKGAFSFAYQFGRSIDTSADITSPKPDSPFAEAKAKRRINPDPLVVQHLSNRVPFALVTGYFYLAAAAVLVFSSLIIWHHIGWAGLSLSIIVYGFAAYALIYLSPQQGPFDFEMSLLVNDLLDSADKEAPWKFLALTGGTGQAVISIWKFQLLLGVLPLGMLSLAVALSSIRPSESDQLDIRSLKRRLWAVRWAIALSSAMLIITVINVRVLLDWPLTLVEKSQADILSPLTNTMVLDVAAGSTLILLCLFFPAFISYILDVHRYRASRAWSESSKAHSAKKEDVDDGLSLAPLSSLASGFAILAPLLASPIMDILKSLFRLFGSN
jgi:hypothetical protein